MARRTKVPRIKKAKGQRSLQGFSGIKVRPNEQEVKIAENRVVKGMKKIEALVDAGIPETNAKSNCADIYDRPGVQAAMNLALKKAGVGVERIAQKLNEGLEATRPVVLKSKIREFPDFAVRHQYVKTASELLDLFPDPKLGLGDGMGSLSVVIKRAAR